MKENDILDSWKEISEYLNKKPRTCARWEKKLGLPVHRLDTLSPRSKVFAYKSEIDKWRKELAFSAKAKKKIWGQNKWMWIGLAASGVLLILILVILGRIPKISFISPSGNLSLAVIPFQNLNSSEYDEYVSEGITNELINALTRLNEIRVIPPASLSQANQLNSPVSPRQISEKFGIDYVLGGKIKKAQRKIYLSVELIRARDEAKIWKDEYEEPLENFFFIQNKICSKIYESLDLKMPKNFSLTPIQGKGINDEAFDSYLKGNYLLSKLNGEESDQWKLYSQGKYYSGQGTQDANGLAINLFNDAIRLNQNFALAYVGLASCYVNYVNFNWDFNISWLNKAESLIQKAQSLSPELPEYFSHLIKIYILKNKCFSENHGPLLGKLAQEGIKKFPYDPQLNSLVGYYFFQKYEAEGNEEDFAKALKYKENSFLLNPYDLNNIVFAKLLMLNREFLKAIEICELLEKNDPSLMTRFLLGEIFYYVGELEKSRAIFEQIKMPLELKIGSLFHLGMIAAQKREIQETQSIIQEINRISLGDFRFFEADLKWASIYFGLGEKELGYKYLKSFFSQERIQKEKYAHNRYIDLDRNFNPFKEKEEFKKILKMGS